MVKIVKVLRGKGGGGKSTLNGVVAANIGESGQSTAAHSRQHLEITQRNGHTTVRESSDTDDE